MFVLLHPFLRLKYLMYTICIGWDLEYNKVIRHYHGHLSGVFALALHPTLDVLITGGRDSVARVSDSYHLPLFIVSITYIIYDIYLRYSSFLSFLQSYVTWSISNTHLSYIC